MAKSAKSDVDPIDGGLLATLEARGRENVTVLAREFGLAPHAAERRCERLAARGFVEGVRGADGYRLTSAGRRFLRTRATGPGSGPTG